MGRHNMGVLLEKLHNSCLERVFRTYNQQPLITDELLEHLRALTQMVDGDVNVGSNGSLDKSVHIVAGMRLQQALYGRPNSIDDRVQIARLILRRTLKLLERREYRSALRVTEHDDKPCIVSRGREFDASNLRWSDDVSGDANHEQVAEALIEYQLRRYTRVGAAEYDRERLLSRGELRPSVVMLGSIEVSRVRHEPSIAVLQSL